MRWITRKEADKLIDNSKTTRKGERLADFIELALHTGARKGELLKLEWQRVSWEHSLITLKPENSEAGKHRTIR